MEALLFIQYCLCLTFFISAKDVEDLQKQMEKLSTSGGRLKTGERRVFSQFNTGCYLIVFEGAETDGDQVEMMRYNGEKYPHHEERRTYEPVLQSSNPAADTSLREGRNEQILQKFMQQIERINKEYKKDKDGTMKVVARYGKLYYFDDPPETLMTVDELSEYGERGKYGNGKLFRSSLIPRDLLHYPWKHTWRMKVMSRWLKRPNS